MKKKLALGCSWLVGIAVLLGAIVIGFIYYHGKRSPVGDPQYVAMGSSFAAGIGLGDAAPDSPVACMRTRGGYPSLLAERLDLPLLDVSCSAATTSHVLDGGQYFQPAQLSAVTPETKLVTITSGGNDVNFIGDLAFAAAKRDTSLAAWLARIFLSDPRDMQERDFNKVTQDLSTVVTQIRQIAPDARILLVTYPNVFPPDGTCSDLNITAEQAEAFRSVGEGLAAATRAASRESGALLVDMQRLGVEHHACSPDPWVNGWHGANGSPFHPTPAGAAAVAAAIAAVLETSPDDQADLSTQGNEP